MKRRNFIGSLLGTAAATQIPAVASVRAPKPPVSFAALDALMVKRAAGISEMIPNLIKMRHPIAHMMERGILSEGAGFNYSVVYQGASESQMPLNMTVRNYSAMQSLMRTESVCLWDFLNPKAQFKAEQELTNKEKNLADLVANSWDQIDTEKFCEWSDHKIVVGQDFGSEFPSKKPHLLSERLLNVIYESQVFDGAAEECEVNEDGTPLFVVICSNQIFKGLRKYSRAIRPAFVGKNADWLKARVARNEHGVLAVSGFVFIMNPSPNRHSLWKSGWVRIPKYKSGNLANPKYAKSLSEDVILWHPRVVKRLTLATKDKTPSYGDFSWRNIINGDKESPEYNPDGSKGRLWSQCAVVHEPALTGYGWVLRAKIPQRT